MVWSGRIQKIAKGAQGGEKYTQLESGYMYNVIKWWK